MEKTNMVTQVTNSNTGGYWFMKPILAAGAALMVGSALAGCSHGNAAPIAAGSNNNAAGGDTAGDSTAPVAAAGGDQQKKFCTGLVSIISGEQHREDSPNPDLHYSREDYTSFFRPGGTYYPSLKGSPEVLKIGADAYGQTHSKELHRRVKDFCGQYFDPVVKHVTEEYQDPSTGTPFTPDWSL